MLLVCAVTSAAFGAYFYGGEMGLTQSDPRGYSIAAACFGGAALLAFGIVKVVLFYVRDFWSQKRRGGDY